MEVLPIHARPLQKGQEVKWADPPPTRHNDLDKRLREEHGPGPFVVEYGGGVIRVKDKTGKLSCDLGADWFDPV